MDPIPASSLMHLEHFAAGTPRDEIERLRHAHRLLWQQDGYARGGHWLVSRWRNLRLVSAPVHFRSNFMDGFKSMQVAFDPVPRVGRSH